ncbi:MAG: hypothetical protein BGO41_03425 [Clostridiales bacterium 38-18]|nr:MAG: hypothetical protein BGO41_03425 [Clostridiales bacterium 38-18]
MTQTYDLDIRFTNNGMVMHIHPVLIKSGKELILVDCGNPGVAPLIKEAISKLGYNPTDLTKIVITHHDHDHFGSLAELKREFSNLVVISSEIEKAYIEGQLKSLRLVQAESIYDTLPEERKEWARSFHKYLSEIEPVTVDRTVKEGEAIDQLGEVVAILTPGHMPGHMSVYLPTEKRLISGDALVSEEGVLFMANPQYSLDLEEAGRSALKLSKLEISEVICYHGGSVKGDVSALLKNL